MYHQKLKLNDKMVYLKKITYEICYRRIISECYKFSWLTCIACKFNKRFAVKNE